jgi:hypothetical protein
MEWRSHGLQDSVSQYRQTNITSPSGYHVDGNRDEA